MPNGDHNQNGKGPFDGRTFLYIRTHPADNGTEPLPSGLPFWVSPDITIIQPNGSRGSEALAGHVNQVEVIVTNAGGIPALDAYVEAFVADPSTAFSPASAMRIGDGFVSIPGYNTAAIPFPWIPLPADAGHRCLLARVCLTIPPDCYKDGTIFDVVGDRHVAQRNIHVVPLQQKKSLAFSFAIVNPLPIDGDFMIGAAELKVDREANAVRSALGCEFARFAESPLHAVDLSVGDTLQPRDPSGDSKAPLLGLLPHPVALPSVTGRVKLKAGQARQAVLMVTPSPNARPGELHVVQVVQFDIVRSRPVGGLWLIVQNE